MFCPHCGNETELVIPAAPAVTDAVDREVEIARINAERDVKVAQINARQERDWNETKIDVAKVEAEAEVAAAEAQAEVIAAVMESSSEPEPEPIVIDAPTLDVDQDDDAEQLPPAEGSPVPEPGSSKRVGLGMW